MLICSCSQKQERVMTPYGSVLDSVIVTEDFDLQQIQTSGDMIMATVSGPQTYYDYHGKSLGTQYLICQRLADSWASGCGSTSAATVPSSSAASRPATQTSSPILRLDTSRRATTNRCWQRS